jgi:hypothetical protein
MSNKNAESRLGCLLGVVKELIVRDKWGTLLEKTDLGGMGFVRFPEGTLTDDKYKKVTSAYASPIKGEDGSLKWRLLPVVKMERGEPVFGEEYVSVDDRPIFRRDYRLEVQRLSWGKGK